MDTKNWYESTTIQGALITALAFIADFFKINIGKDEISQLVIGIFGLIGLGMVIYGRIKAKTIIK